MDAQTAGGTTVASADTAIDGTYSISDLPTGSYVVKFAAECGNSGAYLTQWYNDKTSATSANPVSVTAGSTVTSVDAALQIGGAISGRVTAATGGTDLSGVCVDADDSSGDTVASAYTGVDGTYAIIGLPTGSYSVAFATDCGNAGNFLDQWYDDQASRPRPTRCRSPPDPP